MDACRRLLIDYEARDLEGFETLAARAANIGATHVTVSHVPLSLWQWFDRGDAYPNWTVMNSGILKAVVPPALAEWLPTDEAQRNLELMRSRCEILRKHGLKAHFHGCEPMWLPRAVYEAHPEWRGPHCEQTLISRNSYFSPCIDHPEVLAMYRESTAELLRACPEIEGFSFLTNDSGGGVCWSAWVYPGPNGPTACRDRPMGDRIRGFLGALQDGARDAGGEVEAMISGGFTPAEVGSVLPALDEGQGFCGRDRNGDGWTAWAGCGGWFGCNVYPVKGVYQAFRFAEELERAFHSSPARLGVSMQPNVAEPLMDLVQEFLNNPSAGPVSRTAMLGRVAQRYVGSDKAERLVQVWEHILWAVEHIRHPGLNYIASMILGGPLSMRWLVRPLVPAQEKLTEEERAYWRPFVFTAKGDAEALDLGRVIGGRAYEGWMMHRVTVLSLADADAQLGKAVDGLDALTDGQDDAKAAELALFARRLRVLRCVVRNASNTIRYAFLLDQAHIDEGSSPSPNDDRGTRFDLRGVTLRETARQEMDNALELIGLLEPDPGAMLELAESDEKEAILLYSPRIVEHLRKKLAIMDAHWDDHARMFPSRQRWTQPVVSTDEEQG